MSDDSFFLRFFAGTISDGLPMTVHAGKAVAVMGPGGTGKTTLLKLIDRQLRPDSGRILVRGRDINTLGRTSG